MPLRLIALLSAIRAGNLGVQQSHVLRVTVQRILEDKRVQPVFHIVTDSVIGSKPKPKSVAGGMGVCCIARKSADNDGNQQVAARGFDL